MFLAYGTFADEAEASTLLDRQSNAEPNKERATAKVEQVSSTDKASWINEFALRNIQAYIQEARFILAIMDDSVHMRNWRSTSVRLVECWVYGWIV